MNHVVNITKSICLPDKQFYLVVSCFDTGIADIKPYRVQDMILMPYDLALQFYELRDAAVAGPFDPVNEFFLSFIGTIDLKDQPEFLFEQVCPVQLIV